MEVNDACDFDSVGICLAKEASDFLESLAVGSIRVVEAWSVYQESSVVSGYKRINLDFRCTCMMLDLLLAHTREQLKLTWFQTVADLHITVSQAVDKAAFTNSCNAHDKNDSFPPMIN
jgi:hypothetical protein